MSVRLCAAALVASALIAGPVHAAPLTLDEAWRIAEQANAALRSALAAVHAVQGQLTESRAPLWHNPEASLERMRTRIPNADERFTAWTLGLSQTFEVAGQPVMYEWVEGWRERRRTLAKEKA